MALFEKRYTNKVLLDDTEKLTSVIENARTIDGHTVCVPVLRSLFLYLYISLPAFLPLLFLSLSPPLLSLSSVYPVINSTCLSRLAKTTVEIFLFFPVKISYILSLLTFVSFVYIYTNIHAIWMVHGQLQRCANALLNFIFAHSPTLHQIISRMLRNVICTFRNT